MWDEQGFVFCSNYDGPKARQLQENPKAAILFRWPETLRQVRITGVVHKVLRVCGRVRVRVCACVRVLCVCA
jgi:pyridoxamine 5'-phosphate oxidase